ncbi:MAG: glycoside hydrolase family 2 TIM barrel-domain containing protein, partial [Myxococcota bacterium]
MPKSDADAMPAPAVPVRVVRAGDNWRLERGGQPYVLRGVGYKAELDALVASGGNAIRTWGIGDDTRALLDEAWAKGVSVTLGLWLGHTEHGFDYSDKAAVARQHALIRQQVERFKDHPALLMWGVGNEVELEGGDDPNIWRAIEDVARMIHEVDPHHPTMVVTAEIGETFHERL